MFQPIPESPKNVAISSNVTSQNIDLEFSKVTWDFKLYPNPTSGHVNLIFATEDDVDLLNHVELINSIGSKLESYSCSKFLSIDLSDLPKGVYYFNAFNEKHQFNSQKLVLY